MKKGQIRLPASLLAVFWLASANSFASEPQTEAPTATTEPQPVNWEDARKRIEGLSATVLDRDEFQSLAFSKNPVLTFSDPTRKEITGTVWLIGDQGRPRAILSLFYHDAKDFWSFEFTSLSAGLLCVERPVKWEWKPEQSDLHLAHLKKFDEHPAPVSTSAGRMIQMKALAREFSAAEVYRDGSRIELRMLTQPLTRYSDEQIGVIDAAMFTFANGTNPEILLAIEAVKSSDDKVAWQYGAARMAAAELHLYYQQDEIWTMKRSGNFVRTDAYFTRREPGNPATTDNPAETSPATAKAAE